MLLCCSIPVRFFIITLSADLGKEARSDSIHKCGIGEACIWDSPPEGGRGHPYVQFLIFAHSAIALASYGADWITDTQSRNIITFTRAV